MKMDKVSRGAPMAAVLLSSILASTAALAAPMGGFGGPAGAERHAAPVHMRGHHGGPGGGFAMTDHIEGRIAFLKAELKITAAQQTQWAAVEKAMRDQAAAMTKLRDEFRAEHEKMRAERDKTARPDGEQREAGPARTAPETLALRSKMAESHAKAMTTRIEGQKQFAAAFTTLYGQLSDEQKKVADGLLARGPGSRGPGARDHGPRGHR